MFERFLSAYCFIEVENLKEEDNMPKKPKSSQKRDTYNYSLKDGSTTIYIGATNDPERRKSEHKNSGKRFSSMRLQGGAKTKKSALKTEQESLKKYEKSKGKPPKYNK